jgi:peroxiredoxin
MYRKRVVFGINTKILKIWPKLSDSDSIDSHQKFAKQYKLPYTIVDNYKKIENFGVPSNMFECCRKVTYVTDEMRDK